MPTVNDYIKELEKQRDKLVTILNEKNIDAAVDEKYNSLISKVSQLTTGSFKAIFNMILVLDKTNGIIIGDATIIDNLEEG